MRGNFTAIETVGSGTNVFDVFDGGTAEVLEYPMATSTNSGRWSISGSGVTTKYTFNQNSMTNVAFIISNGKFNCEDETTDECKLLTI